MTQNRIYLLLLVFMFFPAMISADIRQDITDLEDMFSNSTVFSDATIIIGSHVSATEKILMKYIEQNYPEVTGLVVVGDNQSLENIRSAIILVGGPNQNNLTKKIIESFQPVSEKNMSVLVFLSYEIKGNDVLIISDKTGFENIPRTNIQMSPLNKFIPPEYVAPAATVISLFLLWFGKFLLAFLHKVLRLHVSGKFMGYISKKELKKKYKGFKLFGLRFKYREWISISLAALVFAMSITYTYFSSGADLVHIVMINSIVNLSIFSIRNIARLFLDRLHKLHTEYVFWYWGAIITIFSGWLGNTFALAGYMVSDQEKKAETKTEGRIQFLINTVNFAFAIVFFILNFFFPSIILQMACITSISISFIQMLPFSQFSGKNMRLWSKSRWLIAIVLMGLFYVGISYMLA